MKMLITGGAGFVGSAVVRYLIANTSYSIVNIDKLTYAASLESLKSVSGNSRYTFEKIDICNEIELARVFSEHQPDLVMHLAAESHVDRSIDESKVFIQTNIVGTYILLEQARKYFNSLNGGKREKFRFHHISTDEVYGDLEASQPKFTEQTSYSPSSPYAASKASSDHLVRAWHRTFGLPIVITNCSNNYGPYQFPEKLIPLMIMSALEGKPLPVYGKGVQVRDWLHVDDHVKALVLVATKGRVGETYNIGGNNEKQNIDVVKLICGLLDELKPKQTSYKNQISFVEDRPGHDLRYAIDSNKINNELAWLPEESFESGLRKTVQWYLENLKRCHGVKG